ncbi:MAG: hypothetical protein AAGE59_29065 [Cyanobacteria bacterium P01_F01_bin.86]
MRSPRFVWIPLLAGFWSLSGSLSSIAQAQSNELAAECNQLVNAINQNAQIMMAFESEIAAYSQTERQAETLEDIKSAAKQYVDAVDNVTVGLDGLSVDLDALLLANTELSSYRDQYVTVVTGFSETLATIAVVMTDVAETESEEQLPERIEAVQTQTGTAIAEFDQLSMQESDIVEGVNNLCSGNG